MGVAFCLNRLFFSLAQKDLRLALSVFMAAPDLPDPHPEKSIEVITGDG